MDTEQKYPKVRGQLSEEELKYLAKSLGFRSTVFLGLELAHKYPLEIDTFTLLLESRAYDRRLHRTFNTRDANYNVKSVKSALGHLQHKMLSFFEIGQARLAFQLYENDDGMGMHASTPAVLQAFHMCKKVVSPMKLTDILKGRKGSLEVPMRLQLYEFFDILAFHSEPLEEVEKRSPLRTNQNCQNTTGNQFISASDALLTKPERAERYLDQCYRDILFPNISVPETKIENDRLINTEAWQTTVEYGRIEAYNLLPPLMASSVRLSVSRAGSRLRMCHSTAHIQRPPLPASGGRTRTQSVPVHVSTVDVPVLGLHSFSWRSLPPSLPEDVPPDVSETKICPSSPAEGKYGPSNKLNATLDQRKAQVTKHEKRVTSVARSPLVVSSQELDQHKLRMEQLKWQMLRQKSQWLQRQNS